MLRDMEEEKKRKEKRRDRRKRELMTDLEMKTESRQYHNFRL
jgi:hypothetical protein